MKIKIGYSEKGRDKVENVEIIECKNGSMQKKIFEDVEKKKAQKEKTKDKKVK